MSLTERLVVRLSVIVGGIGFLSTFALDAEGFRIHSPPLTLFTVVVGIGLVAALLGGLTRTRDMPTTTTQWPAWIDDPSPEVVRFARLAWWATCLYAVAWFVDLLIECQFRRGHEPPRFINTSLAAGAFFKPLFLYLVIYHLFGRDRMFPNWRRGLRLNPSHWIAEWTDRGSRGRPRR